jgi:hypothetical protein
MKKVCCYFLSFLSSPQVITTTKTKTKQEIKTRTKGKGLVVDIWESRADQDRVSSFKRGYRGRTK